MKILFISVGKKNDSYLNEGVLDYTKRISKYFKTEWKIIPNSDKKEEGEKIKKSIEVGDFVIVLDEKGQELSSIDLSKILQKRMMTGDKRIVFVIGGAYGIDEGILKRANFIWSLSKLTFPHQLVRIILSEAVYRAISLIKGEPYHHK